MEEKRSRTVKGGRHGFGRLAVLGATVTMLVAVPTPAESAGNVGGGLVSGTISEITPPMPPVLRVCQPTTFTVETTAAAFVFNTVISGYAGPVQITGTGASDCESMSLGGGTMDLTLVHVPLPNESEIKCTSLKGGYTRVFTHMTLILSGVCEVNRFGTGNVNFIGQLEFTPSGGGGEGLIAPVSAAEINGAFTISPA